MLRKVSLERTGVIRHCGGVPVELWIVNVDRRVMLLSVAAVHLRIGDELPLEESFPERSYEAAGGGRGNGTAAG